jgi:membrane protein YdbS with pleckstrin-like domain
MTPRETFSGGNMINRSKPYIFYLLAALVLVISIVIELAAAVIEHSITRNIAWLGFSTILLLVVILFYARALRRRSIRKEQEAQQPVS